MTGQSSFHSALRNAAQPVPPGLQDNAGRPAGRRFSVYRNNVTLSLIGALRDGFPAVAQILGEQNFTVIARSYVSEHAPQSPLMFLYGDGFPDFLTGIEPLATMAWLPDLARLEYALRLSYHAADAAPITQTQLAPLTPERLMAARFYFAPAVRLIRSDWPIAEIRRYALSPAEPQPTEAAQSVLITRAEYDPNITVLSSSQADLFAALATGIPLADALDHAPGADFSDFLMLILRENALIALT